MPCRANVPAGPSGIVLSTISSRTSLPLADVANTQSARLKMAMAVKPGAFANIRKAYFRSVSMVAVRNLFGAQRLHRIDQCGSSRGKHTCEQCSKAEDRHRRRQQNRVVSRRLIKLRGDQTAERQGCG